LDKIKNDNFPGKDKEIEDFKIQNKKHKNEQDFHTKEYTKGLKGYEPNKSVWGLLHTKGDFLLQHEN
jgi:hypothetical protein